MAKIWTGPVGAVVRGHVLDCAIKPLEQRLRDYDPFLYLRWNPKKLKGHGAWEIRRKSEQKTVRQNDIIKFRGMTFVYPKYHELDLVNNVLDVPFLNYQIITKLQKMDMWNQKDIGYKGEGLTKVLDYKEAKYLDKIEDTANKELAYNLKQHSSEIKYFKEYVLSGHNPADLARYWGK